ncbi:MAG: pyridoxal-dependent decarboxylase [Rhodothermales bacterium]
MLVCSQLPAATVVEEVAGRWLIDLLGLPADVSFAFVTGCQMAHVTCLAAARNAVLERAGWDVERNGLYGAPPIRIVTADQRHGTIERALRPLGMGTAHIHDIEVGSEGLRPDQLRSALEAAPNEPAIVLLQAGDLNTGAFDPFTELIPITRACNAWVHVDGAFGLWASASESYRHLVEGVQMADSWATDGHKWLNVPYDSGYAFVRDREAHRRAFGHKASYLDHSEVARDPVDWNPEYSRRARGFATYAAIASLGRHGISRIVEDCCTHAKRLVEEAGTSEGVEIVASPIINQGLLRFRDVRQGASQADHDRLTEHDIRRIAESGEAFFSGTTWRSQKCMRVSVSSWATTEDDIDRAIAAIKRLSAEARASVATGGVRAGGYLGRNGGDNESGTRSPSSQHTDTK